MPHDTEDMIQLLLNTNKEQEQTIVDLRATIKELRSTIANLMENHRSSCMITDPDGAGIIR